MSSITLYASTEQVEWAVAHATSFQGWPSTNASKTAHWKHPKLWLTALRHLFNVLTVTIQFPTPTVPENFMIMIEDLPTIQILGVTNGQT